MKSKLTAVRTAICVLALALAVALCAAFTACGDEDGDANTPVAVTGVTLNITETALEEGGSMTLSATVTPSDAADKTVTWSTSNDKVAAVDGGKVTAVAAGKATITAKAGDKTATCVVTVFAGEDVADSFEELKVAVSSAEAEDVIAVAGNITVTEEVKLDKAVTLKGIYGNKLTVSGNISVFDMTSGGATIDGLTIEKTDKTSVDGLVRMGNGAVTTNCTITGRYELGDNEVVRGFSHIAGSSITVTDNTFVSLRQPGYVEGAGVISGNYVDITRGFVVTENTTAEIVDNSFGKNAVDIAIVENNTENNFTGRTARISADNNNCYVENQPDDEVCRDGETVEHKDFA